MAGEKIQKNDNHAGGNLPEYGGGSRVKNLFIINSNGMKIHNPSYDLGSRMVQGLTQ